MLKIEFDVLNVKVYVNVNVTFISAVDILEIQKKLFY